MTVATASETLIPEGTWSIDPSHSTLEFAVRHLGLATVKGRATGFTGTITGGATPAVEGTVPVSSLTTFDENRDGHLASPEFFDAERYPELGFVSTSVARATDEVVVAGDLTIKGITRPVELRGEVAGTGTDPWGNARIGLDLSAVIDRTDFDLRWNAPLPGGGFLLTDEVALTASFSAVKAPAPEGT
jgi:polyisoprenoid-binding protein YceI